VVVLYPKTIKRASPDFTTITSVFLCVAVVGDATAVANKTSMPSSADIRRSKYTRLPRSSFLNTAGLRRGAAKQDY